MDACVRATRSSVIDGADDEVDSDEGDEDYEQNLQNILSSACDVSGLRRIEDLKEAHIWNSAAFVMRASLHP